jgi:hypothetical protein
MSIEDFLDNIDPNIARYKAYNYVRENFITTWDKFDSVEAFIQHQNSLHYLDLQLANIKSLVFNKKENKVDGLLITLRNNYDFVKLQNNNIVDYYRKSPFPYDSSCCGSKDNDTISNLQNQVAMYGYDITSLQKNRIFNLLKGGKIVVNDILQNDLIGIKSPIKLKQSPEALKDLLKKTKTCSGKCDKCSGDCEDYFGLYEYKDEIEFNPFPLGS